MFMHHAPLSSWPGLSRPSIRPRTREEAWRREMPGYPEPVRARPGMTRWVGRSDGSHPQACRWPQLTLPLRPSFISLKRRALTWCYRARSARRSLGYAHTRAAQSRRPGRFAARPTSPCPLQTRSFPPVPSPPSRAGEGERRRHRLRSPSAFQRGGEQGELGRSGVGHEEGRTAGPEHATACRAAWRVGKRAERARR